MQSQPIQISRIYSIWYPCPNTSSLHTIAEDDRLVAKQQQHTRIALFEGNEL